jgi:lysophospholipase L1-like esterase
MLFILFVSCLSLIASGSVAKELRVMALGDSLTSGCTSHCKGLNHPYMEQLQASLKQHGVDSLVHDAGRPNTKAKQILVHLFHMLASHHPDVIVCLAGINDIAAGALPEDVLVVLKAIYSKACSDSQLIILHLLPINPSHEFMTSHPLYKDNDRVNLNNLIATWSESEEASKCKAPPVVLNLTSHYSIGNTTLFSDDVHLSLVGYDLLGSLIAEAILHLMQPSSSSPSLIK